MEYSISELFCPFDDKIRSIILYTKYTWGAVLVQRAITSNFSVKNPGLRKSEDWT